MAKTERDIGIENFSEIKNSLYLKMVQNNDFESSKMLSDMFDIFIDYGGNEFSRGLDSAKQIYLDLEQIKFEELKEVIKTL